MELNQSIELFVKYIKFEKNLTPNTISAYSKDLSLFIEYLVRHNIYETHQINLKIFKNFLKFLDKYNYSNRTILRKFSTYVNYFKFLEQNSLIPIQLSQYISIPKKEGRFYNFLTESEMSKLLESIKPEDNFGKRDRAIFEVFYSTGIRISELTNIIIDNLNLKDNEIKIYGKGRKERIVFLDKLAVKCLKDYLEIRNCFLFDSKKNSYKKSNFLFLNKNGDRISQRYIRVLLKKYLELAKINKKLSPHGLRHSFASHLLQEGAGIREVQELLGHENINTTQIYTHLNIKKIKNDYNKYHPRAN